MKPVSRAFVISALVIGLAVVSTAQSRATNRVANTKVPVPTALSTETFTFATPHESWALGDPLPTKDVAFDGAPLSLMMRRVQVRPSDTGGTELVYPIAGIAFYQHDDVNISYVVARYEQEKLSTIFVAYKPGTVAMPRADFKPLSDGKSLYKVLACVQKDGKAYVKQAISNGADDGKGGLLVDMIAITVMDQPAAVAAKPAAKKRN